MAGDSQQIAFKITNTSKTDPTTGEGAWYLAKDLRMVDKTIAGEGEVVDLKYPDDWDTLVLKPGESTIITGTLKGVEQGGKHTNRVKVTGTPLVECPVTDQFGDQQPADGDQTGDSQSDGDGQSDTGTGTKVDGDASDTTGSSRSRSATGPCARTPPWNPTRMTGTDTAKASPRPARPSPASCSPSSRSEPSAWPHGRTPQDRRPLRQVTAKALRRRIP